MKHSTEHNAEARSRRTILVMGVLALVCVLLGIVLLTSQTSGEPAPQQVSTASVITESGTSDGGSTTTSNTTDSGITEATPPDVGSQANASNTPNYVGYEYVEDVVLVTPAEGVGVDEVAAVLGVDPTKITDTDAGFLEVSLPEGMTVEEAVQTLQASEVVESAQPDYIYMLESDEDEDLVDEAEQVENEEVSSLKTIEGETSSSTAWEETQEEPEADSDVGEALTNEGATLSEEPSEASDSEPNSLDDDEMELNSDSDGDVTPPNDDESSSSSATEPVDSPEKPNDVRLDEQWALESIHAFEAWEMLEKQNTQRVSIAIIDEGFDLTHEDLSGNLVQTASGSYAAYNVVDETTDISETSGTNYHGTHVAGIIAAEANNGLGIAGVSNNQSIIPLKVFYLNSDGKPVTKTSYVAKAYTYIMEHRAEYNIRVVNISFGIIGKNYGPDEKLEEAIETAYNAGIVTVASSGNSGVGYSLPSDNYPSDSKKVVAVINLCETQPTEENPAGVMRFSSSNYNRTSEDGVLETCKEISAPGTDILSTFAQDDYMEKTGTSMAAPCVSGVLALMFAAQPGLSVADAMNILYTTATDIGPAGFDAETGYGEVDAAAAVKAALEADVNTVSEPDDPNSGEGDDPNDGESSSSSSSEEPEKPAVQPAKKAVWSAGATKMPVGSTTEWKLENCRLKVVSGGDVVSIDTDGQTVKARKAGTAQLAVVDDAGKTVKTSTVNVYTLSATYAVCNVGKAGMKLSVAKNSKASGAKVVLTKSSKAKSAKVKLTYKNGYYQLVFKHSGKLVKIKGSSAKQNAQAIQTKQTKAKATQWKVTVDSKNRLTFTNRNSGKVLAAKGTKVVQRTPTNANTEKWLVK